MASLENFCQLTRCTDDYLKAKVKMLDEIEIISWIQVLSVWGTG